MSYYQPTDYAFTYHALTRIRQRLHLETAPDHVVMSQARALLAAASEKFETAQTIFVKINESNLYFVISKPQRLVVTLAPLSPNALLQHLAADDVK